MKACVRCDGPWDVTTDRCPKCGYTGEQIAAEVEEINRQAKGRYETVIAGRLVIDGVDDDE